MIRNFRHSVGINILCRHPMPSFLITFALWLTRDMTAADFEKEEN